MIEGCPAGAVEVEVVGPPTAQLQVTALPLGTDRARLALSLRSSIGSDGALHIQARVAEQNGIPVRISALSWEPMRPGPRPQSDGFRAGRLDMLGVASAFGTSAVPAAGAIESRPIPLIGVPRETGPMVVKVLGTDARGRRVSAWADLNPVANPSASQP